MNNRKIGIFILLICCFGWWWLAATTNLQPAAQPLENVGEHKSTANAVKPKQSKAEPSQDALSEAAHSTEERRRQALTKLADEYRQLRAQTPGNLQAWLEQLWRLCQAENTERCEQRLADLAQGLTAEEMLELKKLLAAYQQYQQQLGQLIMSTDLSPQQRFAEIKALREQVFGEQTETMFGQEHQFAEHQFRLDDFQQIEAAGLSVEQRLAKLNQLQQQSGIQSEGLLGPDQAYQQALRLLSDLPQAEQAQWQDKLRQQYFGDQAQQVKAYEHQQRQHQQKMLAYQEALQQLEARFAALKSQLEPQTWQAQYAEALLQLRLAYFPN